MTIKCPDGHPNIAAQKFCGQCGVSLAGVCANGHQNADGQKYCGKCGVPLGQSQPASSVRPEATGVKPPETPAGGIGGGGTAPPVHPQPQPQPHIDGNGGISDGPSAPTRRAASSWGLNGLKSLWARLPKWGKLGFIGLPLLAVIALGVGGGGRDKESYSWGYQRGTSGFTQDWAKGTSDGVKKTCQDTVDYWIDLMKKKDIDRGDAVEGCMDAVNGRPLGPG